MIPPRNFKLCKILPIQGNKTIVLLQKIKNLHHQNPLNCKNTSLLVSLTLISQDKYKVSSNLPEDQLSMIPFSI